MGAAADFAQGDRIPDFLLGDVGVERHLGAIEHGEQLGLAQFQPDEGFIEVGKAGGSIEDAVEPGLEAGFGLGRWLGSVELEVAVKPPNQQADQGNGGALGLGDGNQAVDQSLGMYPTERMAEDVELAGAVADNDRRPSADHGG